MNHCSWQRNDFADMTQHLPPGLLTGIALLELKIWNDYIFLLQSRVSRVDRSVKKKKKKKRFTANRAVCISEKGSKKNGDLDGETSKIFSHGFSELIKLIEDVLGFWHEGCLAFTNAVKSAPCLVQRWTETLISNCTTKEKLLSSHWRLRVRLDFGDKWRP